MRRFWLPVAAVVVSVPAARAETYTLTLKQAVDRAATMNPEIVMARLDQLKADLAVRVAKDPFSPHVGAGSGLAYSYGFPLSIEGSAPSIVEVRTNESLFNRPQSLAIAQAKENAKGAGLATGEKVDDVAYRIAATYVDVDRAARLEASLVKQVESLQKVLDTVDARVQLGRELPIAKQEAAVNLLRARQRLDDLRADRDYTARSLAAALGYTANDIVQPVPLERPILAIPATEEAAVQAALAASKELKRLDSRFDAKALEIKGDKAQRLPRIDLVAQYALLSQYNNYSEYFLRFQRNDAEIGASIQIPILTGPGVKSQIAQAETDQRHIRTEAQVLRNRIALDVHQAYQDLTKAQRTGELAKAELDLAHAQLSVLLAQLNEGRATLRQVEDARFAEDEKWIAFYDAQYGDEKARLSLLNRTGGLMAALQ
jgi:outer membrane protein TolC